MQVRKGVAETTSEMQERGSRLVRDARVSVRSPGSHPLEQTQNASHVGAIERCHEVHLRSARIGETRVDARVDESLNQSLCAVSHGGRDSTTDALGAPEDPSETARPMAGAGGCGRIIFPCYKLHPCRMRSGWWLSNSQSAPSSCRVFPITSESTWFLIATSPTTVCRQRRKSSLQVRRARNSPSSRTSRFVTVLRPVPESWFVPRS